MVFSMTMIDSFLSEYRKTTKIVEGEWRIAYIKLLSQEKESDPAVLYIYEDGKGNVLCRNGKDRISVLGTSVVEVFNTVNEKINYYNHWERRSLIAVTRNKDQRKNFPLLSQLFPEFSVKILDPEGRILYHDGEETLDTLDPRMIYLMRHTTVCYEVVQGIRDLTVFFSAERYKKNVLFGRISYSDGVFLLFSIIEKEKPITNVETHLAGIAQRIFSRAEYKSTTFPFSTREEIFVKLLGGERCEQGDLANFETSWGGGNVQDGIVLAIMSSIRKTIPRAFPMIYKGRILCLIPETPTKESAKMQQIAESSELKAALSPVLYFWDQIKTAYQLADYVLMYAQCKGYLINCQEYLWDYYLSRIRTLSADLPVHPDIMYLKSLKENRDDMLLDTLYCYLANNCKMAQVAEELHIHLSTLKYRMAHIQDIIGFDPKDYKNRMTFLISHDLMSRENGEGSAG